MPTNKRSRFDPKSGDKQPKTGTSSSSPRKRYAEHLRKMSLKDLLKTYQTASGQQHKAIQEEIADRRRTGRLESERGKPAASMECVCLHNNVNILRCNLTLHQCKHLQRIIDTCVKAGFTRADNAVGGGMTIRMLRPGVTLESVLLRLQEDASHVPSGTKVYFAVRVEQPEYGVVLHHDDDDFVVMFT